MHFVSTTILLLYHADVLYLSARHDKNLENLEERYFNHNFRVFCMGFWCRYCVLLLQDSIIVPSIVQIWWAYLLLNMDEIIKILPADISNETISVFKYSWNDSQSMLVKNETYSITFSDLKGIVTFLAVTKLGTWQIDDKIMVTLVQTPMGSDYK